MDRRLLQILVLVFILIAFILLGPYFKGETGKNTYEYDFDGDGRLDVSVGNGNQSFVFLNTSNGWMPALYYCEQPARCELFAKKDGFVTVVNFVEMNSSSKSRNFDYVLKNSSSEVIAISQLEAQDGNIYEFKLSVNPEHLGDKRIFHLKYKFKNNGSAESNNITIPVGLSLDPYFKDSYFFSPGIFYKNNELTTEYQGTDIDIPTTSRIINRGYYTFLANRPMLPVVANWKDGKMVMMATVDTLKMGNTNIKNSMGWRWAGNSLEQNVWTHGYLYDRYSGFDKWNEGINRPTENKPISKGEIITQEVFIAFDKGELWNIFDYYKALREHYRKGTEKRIYESMSSSFTTKLTHIEDFYDEHDGRFLHVADARDQMIISWVGGVPAGYGLLKLSKYLKDDRLYNWSVQTLDFIADNSISTSGFSYNWYQDGNWSYGGIGTSRLRKGIPARIDSEATFYMLKAYQAEASGGRNHQNWLKFIKSNLNAALQVWRKEGEFGYEYSDISPEIVVPDTPSGILWIGVFAYYYNITGDLDYLSAAESAADYYYRNYVSKGLLYGGELDQDYAPDASSSAHAMAAYYSLYEVTGNKKYLDIAAKSADIYSTYVMDYNIQFEPSSVAGRKGWTSIGLSTSGARNNHITSGCWPGFIDYLIDIFNSTGDAYYLNVASDQYQAALEGYSRYDSDITNVPGMADGTVKKGFGFDNIFHSDLPDGLWFGGVANTGFLHQLYIPAINWIETYENYGNVIVDYDAKSGASLDSLLIEEQRYGDGWIFLKTSNIGSNLGVYKFYIKNLPEGSYDIYINRKRFTNIKNFNSSIVQFTIAQEPLLDAEYLIRKAKN